MLRTVPPIRLCLVAALALSCSLARAQTAPAPDVAPRPLEPAPEASSPPQTAAPVAPAVFDKMQQQLDRIKGDADLLNQSYAQMGHEFTLLQADAKLTAESIDPARLLRENAILKGIIARQIAEQKARDASVLAAHEELKKLGIQSPSLETQIKILEMSRIELTPQEESLLRKP